MGGKETIKNTPPILRFPPIFQRSPSLLSLLIVRLMERNWFWIRLKDGRLLVLDLEYTIRNHFSNVVSVTKKKWKKLEGRTRKEGVKEEGELNCIGREEEDKAINQDETG